MRSPLHCGAISYCRTELGVGEEVSSGPRSLGRGLLCTPCPGTDTFRWPRAAAPVPQLGPHLLRTVGSASRLPRGAQQLRPGTLRVAAEGEELSSLSTLGHRWRCWDLGGCIFNGPRRGGGHLCRLLSLGKRVGWVVGPAETRPNTPSPREGSLGGREPTGSNAVPATALAVPPAAAGQAHPAGTAPGAAGSPPLRGARESLWEIPAPLPASRPLPRPQSLQPGPRAEWSCRDGSNSWG